MEASENAELLVRIKFNGPVNDAGLDTFAELLDTHLGNRQDVQEQRWYSKDTENRTVTGWGMGHSLVTDVERVETREVLDIKQVK